MVSNFGHLFTYKAAYNAFCDPSWTRHKKMTTYRKEKIKDIDGAPVRTGAEH